MYSFSAASSCPCAHGNAALNIPVALMYPSVERRWKATPLAFLVASSPLAKRVHTYHQEVIIRVFPIRLLAEDAAGVQILRQRDAQVGIVEEAKVVGFRRVGGADLAGLDLQFGLAQAAALDEDLIW